MGRTSLLLVSSTERVYAGPDVLSRACPLPHQARYWLQGRKIEGTTEEGGENTRMRWKHVELKVVVLLKLQSH